MDETIFLTKEANSTKFKESSLDEWTPTICGQPHNRYPNIPIILVCRDDLKVAIESRSQEAVNIECPIISGIQLTPWMFCLQKFDQVFKAREIPECIMEKLKHFRCDSCVIFMRSSLVVVHHDVTDFNHLFTLYRQFNAVEQTVILVGSWDSDDDLSNIILDDIIVSCAVKNISIAALNDLNFVGGNDSQPYRQAGYC